MKTGMRKFVRRLADWAKRYAFILVVFLIVFSMPLTACAAIQPGLPMVQALPRVDTVRVVQFTAEQVNNVLDNPTVYDLRTFTRPDQLCPVCWLTWSDGGQRYFAMSQVVSKTLSVLPRGLQATGPETASEIDRNIYNSGWTVLGKYAVVGLAAITRNPGLLSLNLAELNTASFGADWFFKTAYPQSIQ